MVGDVVEGVRRGVFLMQEEIQSNQGQITRRSSLSPSLPLLSGGLGLDNLLDDLKRARTKTFKESAAGSWGIDRVEGGGEDTPWPPRQGKLGALGFERNRSIAILRRLG